MKHVMHRNVRMTSVTWIWRKRVAGYTYNSSRFIFLDGIGYSLQTKTLFLSLSFPLYLCLSLSFSLSLLNSTTFFVHFYKLNERNCCSYTKITAIKRSQLVILCKMNVQELVWLTCTNCAIVLLHPVLYAFYIQLYCQMRREKKKKLPALTLKCLDNFRVNVEISFLKQNSTATTTSTTIDWLVLTLNNAFNVAGKIAGTTTKRYFPQMFLVQYLNMWFLSGHNCLGNMHSHLIVCIFLYIFFFCYLCFVFTKTYKYIHTIHRIDLSYIYTR